MDWHTTDFDSVVLVISELYRAKAREIYDVLLGATAANSRVQLRLETPQLRAPHSNLDIADDYYTALIFGELIAPFCAEIDWEELPGVYGAEFIVFSLVPSDHEGLANKLAWYSQAERLFLEPDDDSWTPEFDDVDCFEELRGFNGDMNANVKKFDDLAECYVRNLEVGLTESYSGKELQDLYDDLRVEYERWWDPSLEVAPLDIDASRLRQGMSEDEVQSLFNGHCAAMCSEPVGRSHVVISDYREDDASETACRLWYIDGRLVAWCSGAQANDPMSVRSPHAPESVRRLIGSLE